MPKFGANPGRRREFSKAVLLVKEKRGIVLNDGGYARAGRRKELSERSSNWGGLRFKMELQAGKWVHTDAEDGKKRCALTVWPCWGSPGRW